MSLAGIILIVITIASASLIVLIGPYIKAITNNYFFWLVLGLVLLTYLITFRFYGEWATFVAGGRTDIDKSRAFFLDLCPFAAFAICILVAVDPTRKAASIVAPFAILGGLLTIVGGYPFNNDNPELTWHYIFIGNTINPMCFIMHYINIVMGVLILVSVPPLTLRRYIMCNMFIVVYFSYIAFMATAIGVKQDVTGIVIADWTVGEYRFVNEVLHVGVHWSMAIGFILAYMILTAIIFFMYLLQKNKHYYWDNTRNVQWYKGWYNLQN